MIPYRQPRALGATPSRGTLYTVRANGESAQRIVVPPVNAVLTDIIGVGLAAGLFFATESTLVKVLAGAGGLWMLSALAGKAYTLARGSEGVVTVQPAA